MTVQPGAKKGLKFIGFIAVLGLAWFGIKKFQSRPREVKESVVLGQIALPDAADASLSSNATKVAFPSSDVNANGGTKVTLHEMTWLSQLGGTFANGGKQTTKNSLFDQYKLQVTINRMEDVEQMKKELVALAKKMKDDNTTEVPGVFVFIMGDGYPAFAASVNKELSQLGPEYMVEAPGISHGVSYGEDKLMAPIEWKRNPKAAIGKTVACYLRDGDMNILLKWAADNDLKVNPDETTYDANAINLVSASDYLDAANKYIAGYKENRKIVNGKITTGATIEVGVDAVATWTPGDVNVAKQKGGLVSIASTKQYSTQMPNIGVGIKKWNQAHAKDIQNIIIALAQAGDQVRSYSDTKEFACGLFSKTFDQENAKYWLKYYNGTTEKDKQGLNVDLGGSRVFNLSDVANVFGLGKDGLNRYKIVYGTFGDILAKMYPELMGKYPKYEEVVNTTYLQAVIDEHPELLEGKSLVSQTTYSDEIVEETSNKSYQIEFEVGSASIKSSSLPIINEILKSAVVGESLTLGIYGHTDNTGDADKNLQLSEARAESVKRYLKNKGLQNKVVVKGFGSQKPKEGVDENSVIGRQQNRRVEVVLGQ